MSKLIDILKNKDRLYCALAIRGLMPFDNDEKFLRHKFKAILGKELDLENPQTFNEKLQWLKLYNRKPEYTTMVDKYAVKKYVADKIGDEYIIPTLGVWDDPDEIDFDALPDQFVLKCNHNSGTGMCICKDKSKIDINKVKAELRKGLKEDYFLPSREWPYKNVPRKIIAEKFMVDDNQIDELIDYKFFCFDGYVDCVMTCTERNTGNTKFYYFDRKWNLLRHYNIGGLILQNVISIPKPAKLDEMFEIAHKLSKGIPHVRVDMYFCNGNIYFGELTFFSQGGFDNLLQETDKHWGELIDLNDMKGKSKKC